MDEAHPDTDHAADRGADAPRADIHTWAALLAHWSHAARAVLRLPDTAQGRAMRASIGDVIALQSITLALGDLDRLPPEERALGRDRAGVLVERHTQALRGKWADQPMPEGLTELILDAHAALRRANDPTGGVD